MQILARHAAKDPAAKKALEEQIRLGRELAEKHSLGQDSDSSSGDEEQPLSTQQLLEVSQMLYHWISSFSLEGFLLCLCVSCACLFSRSAC